MNQIYNKKKKSDKIIKLLKTSVTLVMMSNLIFL